MNSQLSLVHIGENRILLANHTWRPHGREIGEPELDCLIERDLLADWVVASIETFALQPNWAREIFDGIRATYHRQRWLA